MGDLQALARSLGADERTLRRAIEQGTVKVQRPSPRRLDAGEEERRYLARYWPLLSALRRALRTERSVRLAVLFGSVATGDDSASSDIDLLVAGTDRAPLDDTGLSIRLERVAGRRVHLITLEQALSSPSLLADALDEGRVLVDRDRGWGELKRREEDVRQAAREIDHLTVRRAAVTVAHARARLAR